MSLFGAFNQNPGTFNGLAWPLAKRVLYVPIRIPIPILVKQLYIGNGNTVAGNFDVGVYSLDGTKIASSGSTAQSGTAQKQLVNVTDFLLGRGAFYMALTMDGTSGFIQRNSITSVPSISAAGCLMEVTGSFGLPATASFGTWVDAWVPIMGLLAQTVM